MPIARLERTRQSLPKDYQFGDAGRDLYQLILVDEHGWVEEYGPIVSVAGFGYTAMRFYDFHRADTVDPDGYGHAV